MRTENIDKAKATECLECVGNEHNTFEMQSGKRRALVIVWKLH